MIVAIDGPAAAGKGTLARRLAAHFGLPYLDTGLLYRAVGRRVLDRDAKPTDVAIATEEARALSPADLARPDLRGSQADDAAAAVAAMPPVRAALLDFQRRFGRQPRGAVLDGRDIGTVIAPEACAKLFVIASVGARAARRHAEMLSQGRDVALADIEADLAARDERDRNRSAAPLRPAPDAITLDTSDLGREAAIAAAIALVERMRCLSGETP